MAGSEHAQAGRSGQLSSDKARAPGQLQQQNPTGGSGHEPWLSFAGNQAVQRALADPRREIPLPGGNAQIVEGEAADRALLGLGARGASVGSHVLLSRRLSGQSRERVLQHELRHVQQTGARAPDPDKPLRLGARGNSWERQAEGASRLSGGADPQVVRREDPLALSSQLPGVCEPEQWEGDQSMPGSTPNSTPNASGTGAASEPNTCPAEAETGAGAPAQSGSPLTDGVCGDEPDYDVDPTLINARTLTNEELILTSYDTHQRISHFRESSPETAAWAQLESELEDERRRRVELGFVFMSATGDSLPGDLYQLRSGDVPGTTAVYVAHPNLALGAATVAPDGIYMSPDQLRAYIESAGMMRLGGPQAERAMQILESGDTEQFQQAFRPARDPGPGPQLGLSRMRRSSSAADLVSYGPSPWLLPTDTNGNRAVGMMGEASYWSGAEADFGRLGISLNDPNYAWTNVMGRQQSGNFPIADFMIGGHQVLPGPFQGAPVSSAATSQIDQEQATRFLMEKMAAMLDVPGRATQGQVATVATPDMAEAHIRQMAGDPGLNVGTDEFAAAQRRFLSDTMFSVPRERLADIRSAIRQPYTTHEGSRRPAALTGYQSLYDSVLRSSPITETLRNGQQVSIASYAELVNYLPNSLRSDTDRVSGGPGDASLSPAARERVFDLLGRMAESRVIATEDAPQMIAASDTLRGVGEPGSGEAPTRVLSMDIADFAATGQRIRQGLSDPRSTDGPGSFRWRTAATQSQADAYLSFIRALSGNPELSRSDPEFARMRAAVTQEIVLTMPRDQQVPLLEAIMTSDGDLASDIRAALQADNPTIDLSTDLHGALLDATTTFNITTPELAGTRRYATDLHQRYGADAPLHLSADALTLHQQPGLAGVGRRIPGSVGHNLWANALGYGVTMALDSASGQEVHAPTLQQAGLDLAIGVGSEELERQMAARLFSRVPIASAAGRSLFQKAGPGFVIQPLISLGMEEYSISEDRDYYRQMGITMTDEEADSRRAHSIAVGATGAAAGAGALYVIGTFTAGGSAGGPPGALAGFLIGAGVVAFGALASWAADEAIPGSREDWLEQHRRELEARARAERERRAEIMAGTRPLQTFEGDQVPIPFRPSREISAQDQRVIAQWFIHNAMYGECSEDGPMSIQ